MFIFGLMLVVALVIFMTGGVMGVRVARQEALEDKEDEMVAGVDELQFEHSQKRALQSALDSMNSKLTNKLNEFKGNIVQELSNLRQNDGNLFGKVDEFKKHFGLENYTKVEVSDTKGMVKETGLRKIK